MFFFEVNLIFYGDEDSVQIGSDHGQGKEMSLIHFDFISLLILLSLHNFFVVFYFYF